MMVRAARPDDAGRLIELMHGEAGSAHWTPAQLVPYLHMDFSLQTGGLERVCCCAVSDETIDGFVAGSRLRSAAGEAEAELENIVVAKEARRKGAGVLLANAFLKWCDAMAPINVRLEVRAGNSAAIRLYTKLGFTQSGIRRNYYDHPKEDAILMTLRR